MLSKLLLLQDLVAFMQDITPFPRVLMSIFSTFFCPASHNVAGIVLAPLGPALGFIEEDAKVSQVQLYDITSDIAQYGSSHAPSLPPCLAFWAKYM